MTTGTALQLELAQTSDAGAIHRLRRQLEDWLEAKGIEQWKPGEVGEQDIAAQISDGEWHVLRDSTLGIAAALRLLWEDREVWGNDAAQAVYVHGLMVDRRAAGRHLGEALLQWAADQGRVGGARTFRLDCGESNAALRSFYRQRGFEEVGRRDFDHGWFSVTLFEKQLEGRRSAG